MTRKVLFYAPYGLWKVHNQVDGLLSQALTLRGAETLVLRCRGLYGACYMAPAPASCPSCTEVGDDHLRRFGAPQRYIHDFVDEAEKAAAEAWAGSLPDAAVPEAVHDGLPLGRWVESTIRVNHRDEFGGAWSAATLDRYRAYVAEAYVTYQAMRRAIAWFEPDCVVLFSGRQHIFRAAMEAAAASGVDFLTHERGVLEHSWGIYDRDSCDTHETWTRAYRPHADTALTSEQMDVVDGLLASRGLGTRNWVSFEPGPAPVPVGTQLSLPPGRQVVGVFTSSLDEMRPEFQRPRYSQVDLVDNLFALLGGTDVTVVVRHHPNMAHRLRKPLSTILPILEAQKARAPANFRIVMPLDELSSYELFPFLSHAIVPFSTMALELAHGGIRTIVSDGSPAAAMTHRQLPAFDRASLERHLMPALASTSLQTLEEYRRIYRFIYRGFVGSCFVFQSIGLKDLGHVTTEPPFDDGCLMPGQDPTLDQVCDRILNGAPLYGVSSPSGPAEIERESAALRARLGARVPPLGIGEPKASSRGHVSLATLARRAVRVAARAFGLRAASGRASPDQSRGEHGP